MSGRKNVIRQYVIAQGVDASIAFDNYLNPTEIDWLDNSGITVEWTGTPIGEIKVWVSNDVASPKQSRPVVNWVELDFGAPVNIDATNTNLLINMNQLPFSWIAVSYTPTSGTGTLSIKMTVKEV